MPKKLAIAIAGAVSLGSYEAGVLFEVLDAIRQHNRNPATSEEEKVIIDVLTGASAGGMTAIILAQKLMYSDGEFKGPYDNPLYNTWVKRISLAGLQATEDDEPALNSLFSSNLIKTISQEALTRRYATTPPPPADPFPGVAGELRVGVAVTNLNGVPYGYPVTPGDKFVYINYGDQLSRHVVGGPTCDTLEFWEPLRQAAVACGAFPIAFRAQDVQRSCKTEPDDYPPENLEPWAHDPAQYTYSDGGIFQNEPLGMAKNFVDLFDCHLNQQKRFYLFVSPNAKDPETNDSFRAETADYFHLVLRLIEVVMGQSGFQDWITARGVNKRIALLDARAAGLKNAMLAGSLDVDALGKTAGSLLGIFFENGYHLSPGATVPESLDDARKRIAAQYQQEMTALGNTTGQAIAFRDAVLAFETAAELGARDCMTIYGVTATDSELAGAGLQAFLGFFDQSFRDHDYDVGRKHARAVLTSEAFAEPNALGPLRYTPSGIRPIDSRLDGIRLSQVPQADLQAFKAGMRKRLNEMLREILGPVFSVPAVPGSDLILNLLLDHMIHKS